MAISPRILFVGPMLGANRGWVPNPMETLAPHLRQRGYQCRLTSPVINRYARLADILRAIWSQRRVTDLLCIQVYSGQSFLVTDLASWFGKVCGLPSVMVLHGGDLPRYLSQHPRRVQRVLSRAKQIVAPSAYLARMAGNLGLPTSVIPNLLDLDLYPYRHREQLSPAMLWMRTFYDYYQPEMALEVLSRVSSDFPAARLTMAGQDRGLLASLQARAGQMGLASRVSFPGFLDPAGKYSAFAQHDLFLNTTRIDNMPVCLLEAGAAGLPIVSTNAGGIPDLVTHEQSALLVGVDDAKGMAQAVMRLLTHPPLAAELSRGGRALAERSSLEQVVPLWDQTFQTVLHSG